MSEGDAYSCAFCGETVSDDPRWVRIDLTWERDIAQQQIGAHYGCLKAALVPNFPLYDGID